MKESLIIQLILVTLLLTGCSQHDTVEVYYENSKITREKYRMLTGHNADSIKDGFYLAYYPNGEYQKAGHYIRGKKQGKWNQWFEDGIKKEEAVFFDNLYHGTYKAFYPSGKPLAEGKFRMGNKTGNWIYYTPSGKVNKIEKY